MPKAKLQRQNFCQKVLQFICFLNPSKEFFWYTLKPQMQVSFKEATSPSCRVILALFSLPPPHCRNLANIDKLWGSGPPILMLKRQTIQYRVWYTALITIIFVFSKNYILKCFKGKTIHVHVIIRIHAQMGRDTYNCLTMHD